MFGIDVLTIAEVETCFLVEHDAVCIKEVLVEFVEVLLIARQLIHLRHDRHHHIEGIGPPPVVVCL